MLSKEKLIRDAIKDGKEIYEIEEACVFRTNKPSKTEPGQALSVRAHVALANAGVGSLGITDDMFDFDLNTTVDEALDATMEDMLPAGVSSLYDLLEQRTALLHREQLRAASANKSKFDKVVEPVQAVVEDSVKDDGVSAS